MEKKLMTVILKRPEWISRIFGLNNATDIYVAHVVSRPEASYRKVISQAKAQVAGCDRRDMEEQGRDAANDPLLVPKPSDYTMLCVFEGHLDTKLFGWQAY
jgi:hypothetical protein